MMNVLVCYKATADFGRLTSNDWVVDSHNPVRLEFSRQVLNGYEETALEIALRFCEQSSETVINKTCLTIDHQPAEPLLRQLLAVGYDRAVRLDADIDTRFQPLLIANIIKNFIADNAQDLILLGRSSSDSHNGQTAFLLAELMGIPCIESVLELIWQTDEHCAVIAEIDGIQQEIEVKFPAILVIDNIENAALLRVPTLKKRVAARSRKIENQVISMAAKNTLQRDWKLEVPHQESNCQWITGNSDQTSAQKLYHLLKELRQST